MIVKKDYMTNPWAEQRMVSAISALLSGSEFTESEKGVILQRVTQIAQDIKKSGSAKASALQSIAQASAELSDAQKEFDVLRKDLADAEENDNSRAK